MAAAQDAVRENPTPANLDALAKATAAMAELQRASQLEEERTFRRAAHVYDYLKDAGYDLAQTTLYGHIKEGHLKKRDDGMFHMADVKRYIADRDIPRLDGSRPSDTSVELLGQQERQADLRNKKARADRAELDLAARRGELVPRDQLVRDLTARAQVFRGDLKNFARTAAPRLCKLMGGDEQKVPELMAALEEGFDGILARYTAIIEHRVELPTA
jgi:hypothetical protein